MNNYDPKLSIELVNKKLLCNDCNEFTKSLTCIFNKDPDYDQEFDPEEVTIKEMRKHDGFRCANCESLNRDWVICALYHKEKNPEAFKEFGITEQKIMEYVKN